MSDSNKYTAFGHVSEPNLHRFSLGKGISISPSEWENGDHPLVKIHYAAKKHMARHNRNHGKGKKTLLKNQDIGDIGVHQGGSFWSSLRKVADNPIVKGVVKAVAPTITNAAGDLAGKAVSGMTGSDAAGDIAGNLTKGGLQAGVNSYTGSGFRGKKGAGFFDDISGMFGGSIRHGGSFAPLGGGIHSHRGGGGGGNFIQNVQERQSKTATGNSLTDNFTDVHARMAYARSKRRGATMIPANQQVL